MMVLAIVITPVLWMAPPRPLSEAPALLPEKVQLISVVPNNVAVPALYSPAPRESEPLLVVVKFPEKIQFVNITGILVYTPPPILPRLPRIQQFLILTPPALVIRIPPPLFLATDCPFTVILLSGAELALPRWMIKPSKV